MEKILIFDSDTSHAEALSVYLERHQYDVEIAGTDGEVMDLFARQRFQIVLADPFSNKGSIEWLGLLHKLKNAQPLTQIIVYSSQGMLQEIMERLGTEALCYLSKPVNSVALNVALGHAREWISLKSKLDRYSHQLGLLHTAQNQYRQLFNEVPCYISVQDRNFRVTATNRLFKEDFGTEVGSHCYEIYKHRTTQCPNCPVADTFKDGMPHQTEEVVTSKSGRQYNVLTWTAPIHDEQGNITQVMEMSTNITQIRELQDHLTSLGLMLGSMSHGVKGMLTALDGGIYQLEMGLKKNNPERVDIAFSQIKEMAERIRKMVLQILYYAKSRELQYQWVDAHRLARTVMETVFPVAEQNGVSFKADIDPGLGFCDADSNWLQAALVNFLENAVEACKQDPENKTHEVWFQARTQGADRICFEVTDNGVGMDQETQDRMFTLFFSSKGSKGTGLGMFIANHVIRQHGGSIKVTSSIGEGTTSLICLPREHVEKMHGVTSGHLETDPPSSTVALPLPAGNSDGYH